MDENAIIKGYITNLGKYNEGDLAYKLISFPIDEDELNKALKEIGCKYVDENGVVHNPLYEEYFFSDWECEIPFDFGEYPNISEINDIAERVELLATYELETLDVILKEHTSDANEALQISRTIYAGRLMNFLKCFSIADFINNGADVVPAL